MKIGITFSAFDLLHAGHVKMIEDAKRQCDYLIAALQTDSTIDRPEKIDLHDQWWNVTYNQNDLFMWMKSCLMQRNRI